MEFIMIGDERVAIPAEIVSEGRDAVAAWIEAEGARRAGAAPVASAAPVEEAAQ